MRPFERNESGTYVRELQRLEARSIGRFVLISSQNIFYKSFKQKYLSSLSSFAVISPPPIQRRDQDVSERA